MKRNLVVLVALAGLLSGALISLPAEAGPLRWVLGTAFEIGHLQFHLVFRDFDHGRPNYYYRTGGHFRESRHRCTDRCFKENDYYYHDAYCPQVLHHLERNRYNPYDVFERYAPDADEYSRGNGREDRQRYRDEHSYRRYELRYDPWVSSGRGHSRRHTHHHRHGSSCRHRY